MPNHTLPADKMVNFLASEDDYWQCIVGDPQQWMEKKKQHCTAQVHNQKRRHTITTYLALNKVFAGTIPLDQSSPEKEQSSMPSTDTTSLPGMDIVDLIDNEEMDTTHPASPAPSITPESSLCPSPVVATFKSTTGGYKRTPVDLNKLCMKCKQCKANNTCSQLSCKTCCAESTACCSLTDHTREKKGARQPYSTAFAAAPSTNTSVNWQAASELERRIREIIMAKKHVFIAYKSDGLCCNIEPYGVEEGKEGHLVRVMDHTRNSKQSFYITKISYMEDASWQTTPSKLVFFCSIYMLTSPQLPLQ
jgi:hypothetical protein